MKWTLELITRAFMGLGLFISSKMLLDALNFIPSFWDTSVRQMAHFSHLFIRAAVICEIGHNFPKPTVISFGCLLFSKPNL